MQARKRTSVRAYGRIRKAKRADKREADQAVDGSWSGRSTLPAPSSPWSLAEPDAEVTVVVVPGIPPT